MAEPDALGEYDVRLLFHDELATIGAYVEQLGQEEGLRTRLNDLLDLARTCRRLEDG
jgi:hypothetical protein